MDPEGSNKFKVLCRESLAFETAKKEGMPESVVQRAAELYLAVYTQETSNERGANNGLSVEISDESCCQASVATVRQPDLEIQLTNQMGLLQKEVETAMKKICKKKLSELHRITNSSASLDIKCVSIAAREQPPPSTIGASSVYVMLQSDKRLYIGQTDDLQGRVRAHRLRDGMQNASFLYFLVQGKSLACQLETLLINQLPEQGFHLANVADGKHRNFGTSGPVFEGIPHL